MGYFYILQVLYRIPIRLSPLYEYKAIAQVRLSVIVHEICANYV